MIYVRAYIYTKTCVHGYSKSSAQVTSFNLSISVPTLSYYCAQFSFFFLTLHFVLFNKLSMRLCTAYFLFGAASTPSIVFDKPPTRRSVPNAAIIATKWLIVCPLASAFITPFTILFILRLLLLLHSFYVVGGAKAREKINKLKTMWKRWMKYQSCMWWMCVIYWPNCHL